MDKTKRSYYFYLLLLILCTVLATGTALIMLEFYSSGAFAKLAAGFPFLILFGYLVYVTNKKAMYWYPWKKAE